MRTRLFFVAAIVIVLGALAGGLDAARNVASQPKNELGFSYATTSLMVGDTTLTLEIADTPEKSSLGLSFREYLPEDHGMLFIFDAPGLHGFWMKDMQFPIDIAWLNDAFCVVYVSRKVSPSSYPTIYVPSAPARYVIETEAGFLASHNVGKGTCFEAPKL